MHTFYSSRLLMAMRRTTAIVLLLIFAIPFFGAIAEETGTLTAQVVLRKSANKESKALQTLPKGDAVILLGSSGEWYKVNYGNFTGFVMKKYVQAAAGSTLANSAKLDDLGDPPAPMKIGDNSEDVAKLQRALTILMYYNGRIDSDYGPATTTAVAAYQKAKGMEADGVAGHDTVKSIFGSVGKSSSSSSASSSSSTASSKSTSSKSVSSLKAIGSMPSASKKGDSGTKVTKLQQALEFLGYYSGPIDGSYGDQTVEAVKRLQKNRGMKQDGVAGSSTIRVIFGESESASSQKASTTTTKTKTEVLDWYDDKVTKVIPKNAKFTVKDIATGKTFTAVRWSGASHMDAESASAEDTKTLKAIMGGSWSWRRRAILIKYNGHVYAASMNGMPHGTTTVNNNGFDGHFCIHFKNSKTHGSDKVDPDHQKAVTTASKSSW